MRKWHSPNSWIQMNTSSEPVYTATFNWRKVPVEAHHSWDRYLTLWVWIPMSKNFSYLWYLKDNVRGFEEWTKFDSRSPPLTFWLWLHDKVNIRRFWSDFAVLATTLGDFDLYSTVRLTLKNISSGLDNNHEYLRTLVNRRLKEHIEKPETARNCGDKDNWGITIIE